MQAVLESRDIKDIAKQIRMSGVVDSDNVACMGRAINRSIITSYEISKITGESNCKICDKIRRLVPRESEYCHDTAFANESNSRYKAIALTEKGLDIYIKGIEGRGNRRTQKQIEDIRKIREAVGIRMEEQEKEETKPARTERRSVAQKGVEDGRYEKIKAAVDNLVMADSFINMVEDRFIGRDYANLTYQEREDFERLFYFMADQLHSRIEALKDIVGSE